MIIVYLLAMNLISCNSSNSLRHEIDDSLFGETIVLSKQNQEVDAFCIPDDLWVINDSLVLISNEGRKDSLFMIFRISDWSLKSSFGRIGRAKNEFLRPWITKNMSEIMIRESSRDLIVTVDSIGHQTYTKLNVADEDMPHDTYCIDSCFLYLTFSKEFGGALVKIENGNRSVFHAFSDLAEEISDPYGYRGAIGINPENGKVVYAYNYIKRFDIFDKNGNTISINISPETNYPVIDGSELNWGKSTIEYWGASTTADRIYLYYVGERGGEIDEHTISYIEEYDWDGNPIHKYRLDEYYKFVSYINNSFVCVPFFSGGPFVTYSVSEPALK